MTIGVQFKMGGTTFQQMFTRLYELEGTLTVGLPPKMRMPRRTSGTIEAWKVAWILEYGNPNNKLFGRPAPIPERPALRTLWAHSGDSYLRSMRQYAVMHQRGAFDIKVGMGRLGARISKDIMVAYQIWKKPANSPYTIRYKGRNDPLMDRGMLARAWRAEWTSAGTGPRGRAIGRGLDRTLQDMSKKGLKR